MVEFAFFVFFFAIIGLISGYSKKKDTGEFDWKEFGKTSIVGLVFGGIVLLRILIRGK